MLHGHAERVLVESDRLVEVGHGDADVVDADEQVAEVFAADFGAHPARMALPGEDREGL